MTLDEAKLHLCVEDSHGDQAIQAMIVASVAHVESYLGLYFGDTPAPAPVKAAVLMLVADLYDKRGLQYEQPLYTNSVFFQLLAPYRLRAA